MIYDGRDRTRARNVVLVAAALAWVFSIGMPGRAGTHAHHHLTDGGFVSAAAAWSWLLMLAAMMAPVLIQPIQFLRGSSLARRRTRATALFVAAYTAIWMLAGAVLLALAEALESSGVQPYVLVAWILCIALVWQCSPAKQACLNRCHALREMAAFGRAADTDAVVFGATQGIWCAGSCWAWMLLMLVLPTGHMAAMAASTVLIFCERLDNPAPLGWRWRGLGRARRILVAQARLRRRAEAAA